MRVCDRTLRRRKQRTAEHNQIIELAGELTWLANQHPRFATDLHRLSHYVRRQLCRPSTMDLAVIRALRTTKLLELAELIEDTNLDAVSVHATLKRLMGPRRRLVEICSRNGGPPRIAQDGRACEVIYYRLARKPDTETRTAGTSRFRIPTTK